MVHVTGAQSGYAAMVNGALLKVGQRFIVKSGDWRLFFVRCDNDDNDDDDENDENDRNEDEDEDENENEDDQRNDVAASNAAVSGEALSIRLLRLWCPHYRF